MESLQRNLESLAREQGADYFGVADLAPARKFIEAQSGSIVAEFPRAISTGMRLFDGIVDMTEPKTKFNASPYIQHIYTLTLHKIRNIFFHNQAAFCKMLRRCRRSFLTV